MDTYAGTIFDPVSLHKYLYANANPVMNRDPSGYSTVTGINTLGEKVEVLAIIGILAAVVLPACIINLVSMQGVGYSPINVNSITDGMVIDNIWEDIWIDVRIRDEILGDLADRFIRTDSDYDDYGYPDDYSTSEPVGHGNGNAPRNNKDQNDQFDRICKKLNLTKKQARRLHDEIAKKGYGEEEIEAIARSMFGL
ncbi:hypothetical protein JW979_15590 [bacterium]|nr:hypothetical protein [candidate division CSSED10-310 bacterium]